MKKRLYSILCLVSFLSGVVQPALPLIEYYTFQESIIELFCVNKDNPEMDCDGVCYLKTQIEKKQDSEKEQPKSLLALENLPTLYFPSRTTVPNADQLSRSYPLFDQHYQSLIVRDLFHPPG